MLRQIRPYIRSADLAICQLETPMTPRRPEGYPMFNTPTQLARAIRQTGWRVCDTASNHSLDQGQYGIDHTGLALDHACGPHADAAPSRDRQLSLGHRIPGCAHRVPARHRTRARGPHPGSFALGHTTQRTAKRENAIWNTNTVTKHFVVNVKRRRRGVVTGKLHVGYSFLMIVWSYPISHGCRHGSTTGDPCRHGPQDIHRAHHRHAARTGPHR